MSNKVIFKYLDDMKPRSILEVSKAKNPYALIQAVKKYIDQGGQITFSDDYTVIFKNHPIPETK